MIIAEFVDEGKKLWDKICSATSYYSWNGIKCNITLFHLNFEKIGSFKTKALPHPCHMILGKKKWMDVCDVHHISIVYEAHNYFM